MTQMESSQGKGTSSREPVEQAVQLLGLAVRARRVVLGSDAVLGKLASGSLKLLFLARDAGTNASKKFRDKCAFYNIPLIDSVSRDDLGRACGRSAMVVVAVTDPGFATKLKDLLGEYHGGEAFDETSSV